MENTMGGGSASPKSQGAGMEKSAAMSIIINLEKEKLRIASQITRDERTVEDLEKHVMFLQSSVLGQRAKLGSYNSLFMRMSDADTKAPRQRLGAREAVLGTKRIIDKELDRLENEVVVSEMKLNRSRERNQMIREKINQLRREGVTYRSLFEKMKTELADLKSNISLVDRAVDGEYASRDRAYEDMRELAKQFELDKMERLQAFAAVSEDLEALPATTVAPPESPKDKKPGHAQGGKDGKDGEDNALRKRVAKAQAKLSKDRYAIELAQRKLAVFSNALRRVKSATGYSKSTEVTAIFNRYEEEKFSRAQLAQRLMEEIETLESSVAAMHQEVIEREEENAKLKQQRATQIEALQKAATEREKDWKETDAAMQRTVQDVRALYRVIEFAFYALGIRSAMDEVNGKPFVNPLATTALLGSPTGMLGSPERGDHSASSQFDGAFGSPRGPTGRISIAALSPNSPTRMSMFGPAGASPEGSARQHRQRSLSMYSGDARTRHAVRSGVSASSLGAFMGTIENKSAEVIQQYAAVMTKLASGELQAAALRNTLEEAEQQQAMRDARGGRGEDDDDSDLEPDDAVAAAAAAVQARRQANAFAAGSGDMARKLLSNPSVLGPANPPGRVKEAITASALMASLAVDSARMAGELDGATGGVPPAAGGGAAAAAAAAAAGGIGFGAGGGPEDDSKLLSVEELKQQALRRLNTDRNIQALKSAAAAAANVLVSTATNNVAGKAGQGGTRNLMSGKNRE
jgi:hypothetical protein